MRNIQNGRKNLLCLEPRKSVVGRDYCETLEWLLECTKRHKWVLCGSEFVLEASIHSQVTTCRDAADLRLTLNPENQIEKYFRT